MLLAFLDYQEMVSHLKLMAKDCRIISIACVISLSRLSRDDVTFKVNGQRLKPYMEYQPCEADTKINLSDSPNFD